MKALLSISLCIGFLGVAPQVHAAPPVATDSPEHQRALELVAQLGSQRYKEREKAASELVKMGRIARKALEAGKANKDPEIYTRCEQLLPQALALDLLHRIEEYLKDTDGKKEHDLPMLKLFQEKIGKGPAERKLFGEMLKMNGSLLEYVEENPEKASQKVSQRIAEMYQELFGNQFGRVGGYRPNALNPHDLCCVMFATTSPSYKPTQPDWMLANLYNQPPFTNLLKSTDANSGGYRKIFMAHLEARMDDNTINNCSWMLCQHQIKEGADVLAKALKNGKATQVYTKANAICCVGTLGNKDHIPQLADLLKDDTMIQQFFGQNGLNRGEIKVKDVALAMTIHLSGKNPKDYGFTMWQVYPNQMIQYHQLGFVNADDRTNAFKKWDTDSKKPPEAKKEEPKKEEPKKEAPKAPLPK